MKILSTAQVRATDAHTIVNEPISSIDLMERASLAFTEWFMAEFPVIQSAAVFAGIGNNGGDGLAIARLLSEKGIDVSVLIVRYSQDCSEDFLVNEERLSTTPAVTIKEIKTKNDLESIGTYDVVIDALWGSGINRPITGLGKDTILFMNDMQAIKVAVDIPSGMAGDFKNESVIFKADHTLSFELPKLSFFFPSNYLYVGDWKIRSIGLSADFIDQQPTHLYYYSQHDAAGMIIPRKKFSHKGTNGHSLIIAGSYGKIGAGILAAKACLRSGSGLVTVHLPHIGVNPVHAACPELMLSIDQHEYYVTHIPDEHAYDAIAIGPGLDTHPETQRAVYDLIKNGDQPIVIDADALNILAMDRAWLEYIPEDSILTPHPKEFERLFGSTANDYERLDLLITKAVQYKIFILLKGAHTAVACPDGTCWFNSTGNPALATAGSGDVLTGMIAGLMAQGYTSFQSAMLGVYLHGLSADIYAEEFNADRMIASDIIDLINYSFSITRKKRSHG